MMRQLFQLLASEIKAIRFDIRSRRTRRRVERGLAVLQQNQRTMQEQIQEVERLKEEIGRQRAEIGGPPYR